MLKRSFGLAIHQRAQIKKTESQPAQEFEYPEHMVLTWDGLYPVLSEDGLKVLTFNGFIDIYPSNMILTSDGNSMILSEDGTQVLTFEGFV